MFESFSDDIYIEQVKMSLERTVNCQKAEWTEFNQGRLAPLSNYNDVRRLLRTAI